MILGKSSLKFKNLESRYFMSDPDYTIPISSSQQSTPDKKIEYGYRILNSGEIVGGQYRVVKELGSGGFSTTYLAVDITSEENSKYVIKQLQPRFNSPSIWENAKERFATEATVLQWLGNHNQIPQLLAYFEENKQFYLVQEFIEGEEFEQEVNRHILSEKEVIEFLCDVLEILEFVHQQGVVHRDIKPSNLIRRKEDQKIALIDFGAVKEMGTFVFDSTRETLQTQVIGTPGYMSPEQNHGKPIYSSDIYALGKTAIFALTGRSPIEWEYTSTDNTSTWHDRISVSQQLIAVIDKMIKPQSVDRYGSATEVLQDLKPLLKIGTIIQEKYQLIRYLGGEAGICTYVAKNVRQESQPLSILKILTPEQNQAAILLATAEARLGVEIENLAKLRQLDRIPEIQEYFVDRENLYLIQEYVEGEDLQHIINRELVLNEEDVIAFLKDTAKSLIQIHKQKIIHGNIQPSSLIKRQADGKIVIVNFGAISEVVNLVPDSKTGYIPPEQIAQKPVVASDLYALGMTAIQALTGMAPNTLDHNSRTGAVIWQHKARVSQDLIAILDRMVKLDQRQRYQSASQVLRALKRIRHQSQIKSWYVYIVLTVLGSIGLIFGRYLWLQYEAIVLFAQADAQLESRQYEKAIQYYDQGFKKVGKNAKNFKVAWLRKATALSHLKRYEEMLETCDRGLKLNQSFYFWNCKGLALEGLQEYEQAILAYDQAIKLQPEFFEAWNNRGEAYTEIGQASEAKANFEQAIQLDEEKSYVPWYNLGKLHYQQGEYSQAMEAYEQATQVKDDYLPAIIGLGNAQKSARMNSAALESYQKAIEINRDSYEAWFGRGLVQESLRQYQEAIMSYERAISLRPNWDVAIKALQRVESLLR